MDNLKIIYEKFNLMINGQMYGDGSLSYRYNDNNTFRDILAEIILYAKIQDLPNIRMQPTEDWKSSAIWPNSGTEPVEILTGMLYTMIVKVSTHNYKVEFKSRRAVYSFPLKNEEKVHEFLLVHENAPFDNDPTFSSCKRVQEVSTGKVFTYGHNYADTDVIKDIVLQVS